MPQTLLKMRDREIGEGCRTLSFTQSVPVEMRFGNRKERSTLASMLKRARRSYR
jgi:hypothetical protein